MAARSCSSPSCFHKVNAKGSHYHPKHPLLFPLGFSSGGRRRGSQAARGCGGGSRRLVTVCRGGSANGGEESGGRFGNVGDRPVRTLLIDNYDSYTYNIYQELAVVNGVAPVVVRNDEWSWEFLRHQLYDEGAFDNIVISPGPGSPACPQDVGVCLQVLILCEDIPILGVCLGHQALGFVHGANIVHAPEPIHGRLSEIEHDGCNLFNGIPSGSKSGFKVVRYHSLVVDPHSLPDDLVPIAWTCPTDMFSFLEIQNLELNSQIVQKLKNHQLLNNYFARDVKLVSSGGQKIIMGIRHSTRPHYGVQFHPESIATCHGRAIFKNFKSITLNHGWRSFVHSERKVQNSGKLQSVSISPSRHRPKQENGGLPFKKAVNCHTSYISRNAMVSARSKDSKHLKLQWRRFCGLADQIGGSESIFLEFFGDDLGSNTFWLDSASNDLRRARFSFMGGRGGYLWKQIKFSLSEQSANSGGYLTIRDAKGLIRETYLKDGFLAFLDEELQSFRYDKEDYEGLPFDFHGGFIGFLGYNMKVECGASSNAHKSKMPDACFFFADNLIVIDHSNNDVYIIRIHDALLSPSAVSEINNWFDETERRLFNLKASTTKKSVCQILKTKNPPSCEKKFIVEKSKHQYIKDVEKCLEIIQDGESYELCLTTQMKVEVKDVNPLKLYLDLRNQNPAPYASWLNFSEENLSICCSSPERFLRLDGNDLLEAKPIKGTIARGKTLKEDEHLRLQLQYSEKDQAENLMIVDLLRNDLGRVCEIGTVHVPRLMEVESYATVHTLVSTIRGKKKPGLSAIDCIRAAFPGGSMTGAPKLRSMELLDSLEYSCRGIYSGSIGYVSYNQKFDLNIVIRTVVINEEEASIGAGGAIVALSSPEDEYEEMLLKARAPSKAVERQLNELDSHGKSFLMIK